MTTRAAAMASREAMTTGTVIGLVAQSPAPAGSLHRTSGEVFCARRNCFATVSVVSREGVTGMVRYVQWCSLRGIENACPEDCIRQNTAASPATADYHPASR